MNQLYIYIYLLFFWISFLFRSPQSTGWASLVAQMIKNQPAMQETQFDLWVGKIPWRREWLPSLEFLLGEFHGQRSLAGYSPWVTKSRMRLDDQHFDDCKNTKQRSLSEVSQKEKNKSKFFSLQYILACVCVCVYWEGMVGVRKTIEHSNNNKLKIVMKKHLCLTHSYLHGTGAQMIAQ